MSDKTMQRSVKRRLYAEHAGHEARVVTAYVSTELAGEAERGSNVHGVTPQTYAQALWRDGTRKGWLRLAGS